MTDDKGDLPRDPAAELGPAVDEFRAAVERHARELIAAAEKRAAERERDAGKAARRIEQDAERKAERILQAALERASVVLESIDVLESALTGTMHGLRSEADRLTTDLTAQTTGASAQVVPDDGEEHAAAAQATRGIEGQLALVPTGQLRQVVRATIHKMKEDGRPRQDAERFLVRFRLEDAHGDALDAVYGPGEGDSRAASGAKWRGWPRRRRRA